MEQKIHHNLDNSPVLSESYMIQHKVDRFLLDFKGITMQHMDPTENVTIVVNHKAVLMDPWKMKEFIESAQANIKKYEEIYGKIARPTQIEKEIKRKQKKEPKKKSQHAQSQTYVG